MKLKCKIFGHDWIIKERSNVVQYDKMGYPLRLFLTECSNCKKTKQMWIDSIDFEGDVECKWHNESIHYLPVPPNAIERNK